MTFASFKLPNLACQNGEWEQAMDEQEFRTRADAALESLYRKLSAASDQYEFEPDFNSGALAIEFEKPKAKFVVSPNTPVRQIWVSAHSKSFKLDWVQARNSFVLPDTSQTLDELIGAAIGQQVGEVVRL
jgi:CyaY protein